MDEAGLGLRTAELPYRTATGRTRQMRITVRRQKTVKRTKKVKVEEVASS